MNMQNTVDQHWNQASDGAGSRRDHSGSMFQLWFERTADAAWLLDPATRLIVDCNAAATMLMGCSRKSDLVGRRLEDLSPGHQADRLPSQEWATERMEETLRRRNCRFEWMAQRFDGTVVAVDMNATLIERGGQPLIVLLSRDITVAKETVATVRESEARLRSLLERNAEAMPAELLQANEQLKNEVAERRRQEKIQRAVFQISEAMHTVDDLSNFYERVHSIIKTLMPARNFYIALLEPVSGIISFPYFVDEFSDDYPEPRPVGTGLTGVVIRTAKPLLSSRSLIARARRIGDAALLEGVDVPYIESGRQAAIWLGVPLLSQGNAFGVMAVQDYLDESAYGENEKQILNFVAEQTALAIARKRAEKALRDSESDLLRTLAREKELGQLRSNFVSMVSHEFRTPLAIIQSSAEILQDYIDRLEPAERSDHLQSIHQNTRHMAALMDEVLLIGRFDAGKMEFKPAALDLRAFAGRLVDEVLSATNRRCPINLLVDDIPADAQADERLLRPIFTNLLTNAVKYSDSGCTVRFDLKRSRTEVVCAIQDQGIGIPEADREWLFSAFHRGRNVGERPGTGLGLVIVKRCVDLHGGQIKVESTPGLGTTVTVTLAVFPASP